MILSRAGKKCCILLYEYTTVNSWFSVVSSWSSTHHLDGRWRGNFASLKSTEMSPAFSARRSNSAALWGEVLSSMFLKFSLGRYWAIGIHVFGSKTELYLCGIIGKSKIYWFNIMLPDDMLLLILRHQDFSTLHAYNLLFTF